MATAKISIKKDLNGLYYATWGIKGNGYSVYNPGTSFYEEKDEAVQEARDQVTKYWENSFEGKKSDGDLEFSIEDNT
jgi:hypothetical protein